MSYFNKSVKQLLGNIIVALLCIHFSIDSFAQSNGNKNILAVEGGGIPMEIDTMTPLPKLLSKLNLDWRFKETGKAYWIGYTQDMFSIAQYGESAISDLMDFHYSTDKRNGKIGVIYTLHLIGIKRKIAGRMYEEFKDEKARNALIKLLEEREFTYQIMYLLMRDPWISDVGRLFHIIDSEEDPDVVWPIINALNRYKIDALPINTEIPKKIKEKRITLDLENEHHLEPDFEAQIKTALKRFADSNVGIKVEDELYQQELSPFYSSTLENGLSISDFLSSVGLERGDVFRYIEIGSKMQYTYENNLLTFLTIKTAQQRLRTWWQSISENEKKKYQ